MYVLLIVLFSQFGTQYKDFLHSTQSDSLFIALTRGEQTITEFANEPIVLWFWRSNTGDPEVDSLLKRTSMPRNFYLSAILRWEAQESEDYETALNKLDLAVHLDPYALENFLSYLSLAVRYRTFDPVNTAFSLPVFSDLRSQVSIIINAYFLIVLALFMCGFVFIIVKMVYYIRVLSHRLDPLKHSRTKGLLALLLLLIPILVLRHLYLVYVVYAAVLVLVFTTREKNWLRSNIILLVLLGTLSSPLAPFVSFLKKYDRNYQLYHIVQYDSDITFDATTNEEKKLVAYGLKQRQQLEQSMSLYEELYYQGNRDLDVINNLANLYYLYDEDALADTLYTTALRLYDRGEPYFNIGLLKLKNIEYLESSHYMEEARMRNFSSPLKEPVDIAPTNSDLYAIIRSQPWRLFGVVPPVVFIPLIVVFILSFLPFQFSQPFYCESCSRPVCRQCLREIEGEVLCDDCFTKFKSAKSVDVERSLRNLVEMRRKKLHRILSYVANMIVPGAGLIYCGKHMVGLAVIFFVMLAYVPLLFPRLFITPADWISLPLYPIFCAGAAVIALVAYVFTFLVMRSIHAD
jgi:hypothetical protein